MAEENRLPPNQHLTQGFPVLHPGSVPRFDPALWDFRVGGLVENPLRLTWEEFCKLPRVTKISDFHCVTGWSRFDNRWEGVLFKTMVELARPRAEAAYVTIAAEGDYTTSLPLVEVEEDVLLALKFEGRDLEPVHGGPLRLVVPRKYAYKSAKWVRALRFTWEQERGYWEQRGYSNTADPWREERYS